MAKEEVTHDRAMAELAQPIEITPPYLREYQEGEAPGYAAKVEQLQMMVGIVMVYSLTLCVLVVKIFPFYAFILSQIADEQAAIAKVAAERKGRIPLSVCHQLEQCIREVDVSGHSMRSWSYPYGNFVFV